MDQNKDNDKKQQQPEREDAKSTQQGTHNIPERNRSGGAEEDIDAGKDTSVKSDRKGAGQQQGSGGNPVVN